MKIGIKLTSIMIVLSLLCTGTVSLSLLVQTGDIITSLSHDKAIGIAQDLAGEAETFFASYLYVAETFSNIMENFEDIPVDSRRSIINSLLYSTIRMSEHIYGMWVVWEPDVLEGNDRLFLESPGSTDEGRFSPYWYRDGNDILMYALEDFDEPGVGDYYLVPMRNRTTTIIDPTLYEVGGSNVLLTTIVRPLFSRDGHRQLLGAVGLDISGGVLQQISQRERPFGNGMTAIFSNSGIIAGHFDPSRLGRLMQETEQDMAGPFMNDLARVIRNGETFHFTHFIESAGERFNVVAVPILIGDSNTPWSFTIAVPTRTVMASLSRMQIITLVISVILLAIVIPVAIFLSRTISKPIVRVTETFKDISQGDGDLTRSIDIKSKDEIGSMAHYFNLTLEKIKNMVMQVRNETKVITGLSNSLSNDMTETAAAMNEITANIQSVKQRMADQSASVTETNSAMEQITVNINKLNDHVERQSTSVAKSSTAIEQMLANIQSVTQTLVKNTENVDKLSEASDVGRSGLQDVAADIQEIARESEDLLEINAVMEGIASQTNLLSMNAAIEAAHAGEAGKGFAVVAEEIRKLAESSSEQSKTISTVLKKIKSSIDKIMSSTDSVLKRFEAIDSNVKIVAEQEENIRSSMEEQSQGSKQILEAIGHLNDTTQQVKSGSQEMLEGAKEVMREADNLERSTQEITGGMNEMASGMDQVNIAVNNINELTNRNRDTATQLMKEVAKFKIE